jgi:ubiquinone/menaquinone biosynthesis C-methylase UbiE
MDFWDRHLFKDSRAWVCGQASGEVLEVAIGTGMNLPHYRAGVRLTGVDFSPEMLALARDRAAELGLEVELREGDAQQLDLPDASVDSVVCTFGLCAIPDDRRALREMHRVLRPGGLLLLADHVAARSRFVRGVQRVFELGSVPLAGEHFRRRLVEQLAGIGFVIERQERFGPVGLVERVSARKLA